MFIHLPTDGSLDCSQILAMGNKEFSYTYVYMSVCGLVFSFLLVRYPGMKLLSYMADVFKFIRKS